MEASLKATPILLVFHALNTRYQKDYCWPSQRKILELLGIYRGIHKCRSTLNLWLTQITKEKYIIRRRRIRRDPQRGMVFKSTMYKITRKGYYFLIRCGVSIPQKLLDALTGKTGGPKKRDEFSSGRKKKNGVAALVEKALKPLSGVIFT